MMYYICSECRKTYEVRGAPYCCRCGGLFNLGREEFTFTCQDLLPQQRGLFRYIKALPFSADATCWQEITMGEGLTPLIPLSGNQANVLLKVDYMMPTLSFKDRGAVVLIAKAMEMGIKKVIQDSSGNAGTSIAAYASRAGIACDIYLPQGTSPKKIQQITTHGATVIVVKSSREDTAAAALQAVKRNEGFYASHVYNPFFYEGTKTIAYEVFEQLQGNVPDVVVTPVGNGSLLLGIYYGFKELYEQKLIAKIPQILAIQAKGCAPLAQAFTRDSDTVIAVPNSGTMAEGIAIANPLRGRQLLQAIRASGGKIMTAPEDKII
ncbi:MAG: threonine synthase, partial [Firmicutes bacterium]|nr:threonine synthase [Bacillota bacterium]